MREVYSSMLIQEKKNYLKISDVAFNFRAFRGAEGVSSEIWLRTVDMCVIPHRATRTYRERLLWGVVFRKASISG